MVWWLCSKLNSPWGNSGGICFPSVFCSFFLLLSCWWKKKRTQISCRFHENTKEATLRKHNLLLKITVPWKVFTTFKFLTFCHDTATNLQVCFYFIYSLLLFICATSDLGPQNLCSKTLAAYQEEEARGRHAGGEPGSGIKPETSA